MWSVVLVYTDSNNVPVNLTGYTASMQLRQNYNSETADLTPKYKDASWDLAEELRLAAKAGEKRISYIIHHGKIASPRMGWKWRTYKGNPHAHHIHISFTPSGDTDGKPFLVESLKK